MISQILSAHDTDTVQLRGNLFIAQLAYDYRTSQTAIIAALRPCTTPSQPEAPSKPHAPAAQTDGDGSPPAAPSVAPTSSLVRTADEQARHEPIDEVVTPPEHVDIVVATSLPGAECAEDRASIPEAPKPLPDASDIPADALVQPAEAKTLDQADGGAVSAVKGANARLENAEGVEPPPSEPSPRMTKREQVRECHEQHPDWTSHQIAEHLGFGVQHVQVMASHLSLKLPRAPRTAPENMRDKVLAVVAAHPEWTLRQIAAEAGCSLGTASKWAKQAAAKPPEAEATPDEPQAGAEPERLPASTKTAPALPLPPPIVRPVRTTPTGRFYLREKAELGKPVRYVHQSLSPCPTGPGPLMTLDRKWAWFDTMDRYRGALKQWPQITSMLKEAVSK